jgi:hypothetical protein
MRDDVIQVNYSSKKVVWLRELFLIAICYTCYSWVRNQFGSASVTSDTAYRNADYMIETERFLGLYFEPSLQSWFDGWVWFLRFWNIFYGTLHFVMTLGVLIFLFIRVPVEYVKWRTIGLLTTGRALIGFALFPLMPPRLLGNCREVGACVDSPFIDTMAEYGGLWSFDSGLMESLSNQYAAMPSLHFAWALWSWLAIKKHLVSRTSRIAIASYPSLTLFAIIVTANHYWIDAVGGVVVLGAGYYLGIKLNSWVRKVISQTNTRASNL